MPPLPTVQAVATDNTPRPLHVPPAWTVARGGTVAGTPAGRVEIGGKVLAPMVTRTDKDAETVSLVTMEDLEAFAKENA